MLPGVSPDFTPQLDGFFDLTHRGSHWRSAGCQTLGPPCFVLHLCCVGVGDKIPPWVIRIDGLNDVFVFNGLFMYLNITFETETVKENWFLAMWKHDISWFGEESVWFLDYDASVSDFTSTSLEVEVEESAAGLALAVGSWRWQWLQIVLTESLMGTIECPSRRCMDILEMTKTCT